MELTAAMDLAERGRVVRGFSAGQAIWWQVLPGLLSLPVFAGLAWWLGSRNLPSVVGLALTVALVEVPVSWAIMVRQVRKETGRFAFRTAFPWTRPLPWWQYLVIGVPVVLFSMALIVGVGPRVEAVLQGRLFGQIPEWFVIRPDPTVLTGMSGGAGLVFSGLMLLGLVVAGGVTQELFSRGFLLPRTAHLGLLAPALNAAGFAMLHIVAPWGWPTFFLLALPWAYLVWWRRSVKIGLFAHIGMLGLQWLGMTLVVLGVVAPPG